METRMKTVSISLPGGMVQYVRERAREQGDVSDYICTLIREDRKREEAQLEKLLLEGMQSPKRELTLERWKQLKAEILEKIRL
jgi:Arc/MetJ-type ribon-helix-helix transcriptional regulator